MTYICAQCGKPIAPSKGLKVVQAYRLSYGYVVTNDFQPEQDVAFYHEGCLPDELKT